MTTVDSLAAVASEFPVLRRQFGGHQLVYLDSSATSQTPQPVIDAMTCLAGLAAQGREALLARDTGRLARLIDANFDTRRSIYRLPAWQIDMVETARGCGASAKFAGSGGAIVGTYDTDATFEQVSRRLAAIGSRTIPPHG